MAEVREQKGLYLSWLTKKQALNKYLLNEYMDEGKRKF